MYNEDGMRNLKNSKNGQTKQLLISFVFLYGSRQYIVLFVSKRVLNQQI